MAQLLHLSFLWLLEHLQSKGKNKMQMIFIVLFLWWVKIKYFSQQKIKLLKEIMYFSIKSFQCYARLRELTLVITQESAHATLRSIERTLY